VRRDFGLGQNGESIIITVILLLEAMDVAVLLLQKMVAVTVLLLSLPQN
jgi:hypothetical protein